MASVICISDYTHIVYKKIVQASEVQDIARKPYLILDFVYNIDGERVVEGITAESRHRFAECDPSSVRAFIEGKEPLPLDTMVDPEEAEIVRETVSDAIASLVRDCAGVEGLKTLQVDVMVDLLSVDVVDEIENEIRFSGNILRLRRLKNFLIDNMGVIRDADY